MTDATYMTLADFEPPYTWEDMWDGISRHPIFDPTEKRPVDPRAVVYYARREFDGSIKIGTSCHLRKRIRALSKNTGPLTLLATEPGDERRENARHLQFDDLNIRDTRDRPGDTETEWFRPGEKLMALVALLAAAEVG